MDSRRLLTLACDYLDGEMPAELRRRFERRLRDDPALAGRMEEYRRVIECLRRLPRASAPADATGRWMEQLSTPAPLSPCIAPAIFADELTNNPVALLHAYADGELSPSQRDQVERRLLHEEGRRTELARIQQSQSCLKSLPPVACPSVVRESLIDWIHEESPAPADAWDDAPSVSAAFASLDRVAAPPEVVADALDFLRAEASIHSASRAAAGSNAVANATSPRVRNRRRIIEVLGAFAAVVALAAVVVPFVPGLRRSAQVVELAQAPEATSKQVSLDRTMAESNRSQSSLADAPSAPFGSKDFAANDKKVAAGAHVVAQAAPEPAPPAAGSPSVPAHAAKRSTLEEDDEPPPKEVAPVKPATGVLPLSRLATIQVGELVKLNDQQIEMVCVDVGRMADRLRIVLSDNEVRTSGSVDGFRSDSNKSGAGMHTVEITATPEQLKAVIDDLYFVEQRQPLISSMVIAQSPAAEKESIRSRELAAAPLGAKALANKTAVDEQSNLLGRSAQSAAAEKSSLSESTGLDATAPVKTLADAPLHATVRREFRQSTPAPAIASSPPSTDEPTKRGAVGLGGGGVGLGGGGGGFGADGNPVPSLGPPSSRRGLGGGRTSPDKNPRGRAASKNLTNPPSLGVLPAEVSENKAKQKKTEAAGAETAKLVHLTLILEARKM